MRLPELWATVDVEQVKPYHKSYNWRVIMARPTGRIVYELTGMYPVRSYEAAYAAGTAAIKLIRGARQFPLEHWRNIVRDAKERTKKERYRKLAEAIKAKKTSHATRGNVRVERRDRGSKKTPGRQGPGDDRPSHR